MKTKLMIATMALATMGLLASCKGKTEPVVEEDTTPIEEAIEEVAETIDSVVEEVVEEPVKTVAKKATTAKKETPAKTFTEVKTDVTITTDGSTAVRAGQLQAKKANVTTVDENSNTNTAAATDSRVSRMAAKK